MYKKRILVTNCYIQQSRHANACMRIYIYIYMKQCAPNHMSVLSLQCWIQSVDNTNAQTRRPSQLAVICSGPPRGGSKSWLHSQASCQSGNTAGLLAVQAGYQCAMKPATPKYNRQSKLSIHAQKMSPQCIARCQSPRQRTNTSQQTTITATSS